MAARILCTLPLLSVCGRCQLFLTAPDKQTPASTQRARWHVKSRTHSGQNTKHQQQDDGWKLRFKSTQRWTFTPPTHIHTHTHTRETTHVRPQPGPSDWLLLPACCILDRSMCSTYVWIIWWREKRKDVRKKREKKMMFKVEHERHLWIGE